MVAGGGAAHVLSRQCSGPAGRAGVVQVLVVEQLLCVHADGGAHVQAQLPLKEFPLAGKTLLRVHLTWRKRRQKMVGAE